MPQPTRRNLLNGVAMVSTVAVAGCLGAPTRTEDPAPSSSLVPPTVDPDELPLNEADDIPSSVWKDTTTFDSITLGARDGVDSAYGPHGVRVLNLADVSTVRVGSYDVRNDRLLLDETYAIPPDEHLSMTLESPSQYVVSVEVPETDTEHLLQVPCRLFDCNSSSTNIFVLEPDRIASAVLSTLVPCPGYSC